MLYTKIQPQSFLSSGEDFSVFTIYGHVCYIVQWREIIRTKCQYPFDRRLHVKSGENGSSGLKEEVLKNYTVLCMYIVPEQGQITPR